MGKGDERSLNPMDSFRREQKRKEIKKAKATRDLQKKQDEDERDKYNAILLEYNQLSEDASKRALTPSERSRRKEMKQYLDANLKFAEDTAAKRRKIGEPLPSGLYDPLSEEHQLMYERSQIQPRPLPPPTPTPAPPPPPAPTPPVPVFVELPDSFFPDLPNEPLPRFHKAKHGPPTLTVMAGYPPPPTGPLPSYPPQLPSPLAPAKPAVKVISAQPQLRDLKKETIAFVPTHVAVPQSAKKKIFKASAQLDKAQPDAKHKSTVPKDEDVYDKFLQEMQGLI